MNSILMYRKHFTLEELNHMIPWEREIYVLKIQQHMEEEEEAIKEKSNG